MAEADLNQILGYIRERETNLSRYSDKLRQSIVKIADVFGKEDFCRCGWFVDRHPIQKAGEIVCKTPIPKIQVSVDVIDDQPFMAKEEDEYSPTIKYYLP